MTIPSLFHIVFYKFVRLADPKAIVNDLTTVTENLTGSILVASEGINGMLAGTAAQLDAFIEALTLHANFHGMFAGITYQRTRCAVKPFGRLKIHLKKEIVPLGIESVDPTKKTGIKVNPEAWRELIARDDVVVIDNRNSFEYQMGHFNNAVNPQVRNFRDFPKYIEQNLPRWRAEGKKLAMYCTGGIRCEKASAWMADLGVSVYQLEGGILNYLAQMPNPQGEWQGECFVFDNRVSLDANLKQTGATPDEVYASEPDAQWRIARARRLAAI